MGSTTALQDTAQAQAFLAAHAAAGLGSDTRRLRAGEAFIAWPGLAVDPRRYVAAAFEAGAPACIVDADGVEAFGFDDPRIGVLPGLKQAAGELAAAFFGHPGRSVQVIAVTGTNGKTSTAWWTAQLLSACGQPCALIGTLGEGMPFDAEGRLAGSVQPTGFTTPDPVGLQAALRRFADAGCRYCALEASSIGIDEHRMAGLPVAVAQFTNFTRDHLDYHGTMDAYWAAKRRLFNWPGLRAAVVNVDDEHGAALADELAGAGAGAGSGAVANEGAAGGRTAPLDLWTVAVERPARLRAGALRHGGAAPGQPGGLSFAEGLSFDLIESDAPGPAAPRLHSPLIGQYNASNLLGVLGALRALGVPLAQALHACRSLQAVPGRMQRVNPRAEDGHAAPQAAALPLAVVDYAHTPDALQQALRALRPLAQARGGRLWCVFGCGGNRDATKRPLMGAIAQQHADHVVLTSDNPRHEAPGFILSQILAGVSSRTEVQVIEDRAEAIAQAIARAAPADVVLIAGKGHEAVQEVAGRRLPFSDVEHAQAALQARGARA